MSASFYVSGTRSSWSKQKVKNQAAQGKSIGARLSRLAREKGFAYEKVLTDFLIERMVARLVGAPELRDHLVFKGGYVAPRVFRSPRFTIDLDAIVHRLPAPHVIKLARDVIEGSDLHDGVWFRFEAQTELALQSEYGGTRLVFRTGLGIPLKDLKRAQIINFDVGTGDPVVPAPIDTLLSQVLLEGTISWRVYTPESIVSEKIHVLCQRGSGSSRSKDIFDLGFLIECCDGATLQQALRDTFAFRAEPLPLDLAETLRAVDRTTLRKGWAAAMTDITPTADLDATFELFVSHLAEKLRAT